MADDQPLVVLLGEQGPEKPEDHPSHNVATRGTRAGDEGARANPEDDIDLTLVDLDPLAQRAYDTTLGLPIELVQPVAHSADEVVQVPDD